MSLVQPHVVAVAAILLCILVAAANSEPGAVRGGGIPWNMETLQRPPQTHPAPGPRVPGLRALFYEGLPFEGRRATVFAWYGKPRGASAEHKVPGIVLVHGGGGTAFETWVRLWNKRGYAAIAMDHNGGAPKGFHN